METSLPQKMFHVFWMVLSLSLILSVIPTAFAETGARHLSGIAKSFDTKKEMLTWLGPFEQCPLKIEDALYDPRKDRMAKLRKPGEVFHSNKDNQLLIKARLFDRIQRHFGIPEKNYPPYDTTPKEDPFPDIDPECGNFCDDPDFDSCPEL